MRVLLRWFMRLAVLSAITSLLFASYQATRLYLSPGSSKWSGRGSPYWSLLPSVKTSQLVRDPENVNDFWYRFSAILQQTRPTSPVIQLKEKAQTRFPSSKDDGVRMLDFDLVSNSQADTSSMRDRHAMFLKQVNKVNLNQNWLRGRGIVIVGGGEFYGPAIVGINMLRRTGCTLPVELFVPSEDEFEAELCENYLPKLDAHCIVMDPLMLLPRQRKDSPFKLNRYQLKSMALLFSTFAEILLLDSDSIPLVDPGKELFQTEPYMSKGLVVWPDFWRATESPRFWSITGMDGLPPRLPSTSSEAGQILINKNTHLSVVLLSAYYNIFGPEYYYPLLSQGALGQGDKETFMAAAVVLNSTYYRVQTPVKAIKRDDGVQKRGTAMVQFSPADDWKQSYQRLRSAHTDTDVTNNFTTTGGSNDDHARVVVRPAFLHSNTPKMNAGHLVDEGDLFSNDGSGRRLRLLGSLDDQQKLFGFDLERSVWEILVQTGCELAHSVREWKHREKLCERLQEHVNVLFVNPLTE